MISGFDFSDYETMHLDALQAQTLSRNIYFAYLRAGHGLADDTAYRTVRADCERVAVLNGAYLFVMPNQSIDEQVTHFKNMVNPIAAGNLPPCLDFEWTKRTDPHTGQVLVPEYWRDVPAADRIPLIKDIVQKAELALRTTPAVYTHSGFWDEYIIQPNQGVDVSFLARHPLWLVDVHGDAAIPPPWTKANFVQTAISEDAPPGSAWYDTLDQDLFNGSLSELLDQIYPGFTLSMSANPPVSAIVRDCQTALTRLHIDIGGVVDGKFGVNTKRGVQQFQTGHGLNPTGQLDVTTMKRLLP